MRKTEVAEEMNGLRGSHEILDHTSEVILRVRAADLPGALEEAARAFASLVPGSARPGPGIPDPEPRAFRLEGSDPAALLVGWLNELAFLAESESWIPAEVRATLTRDPEGAEIEARGVRLPRPFVLVKAATFHDFHYREGPGGVEAEVTLDL